MDSPNCVQFWVKGGDEARTNLEGARLCSIARCHSLEKRVLAGERIGVCRNHFLQLDRGYAEIVPRPQVSTIDAPPQVWLKGPYERKRNRHGQLRCAVSRCRKRASDLHVLGQWVCQKHHTLVVTREIMLVPEASPDLPIVGGRTIEEQSCHARGCESREDLRRCHNGFFCPPHAKELNAIRRKLQSARDKNLTYIEVAMRAAERSFRKYEDLTHSLWLNYLEDPEYPE